MCSTNDLKAQTRISSGEIMRVMGGVTLASTGLFVLGIALAVGMTDDEIEPFRAAMTIGAVTAVIGVIVGGIAWSHAILSRKLTQLIASAGSSGVNGRTSPLAAGNVSSIDEARFP